jgi:PST family polysaccharide transporter
MNIFDLHKLFKHTLIKNISSLYIVQGLNYIFPVITLPYLTRTLGVEEFGKVILAQTIALFGSAFVGYGFSLSASRKLALARGNKQEISEAISNTLSGKIILTAATIVVFVIIHISGVFYHIDKYFFEILLLALITGWNFLWFFRGIEKMYYLVVLELLNKVLFTVSIFIFVVHQHDGMLVLRIQSLCLLLPTAIGFIIALQKAKHMRLDFVKGMTVLAEDRGTFIFSGLAMFHSNTPILFISYFATPYFVGIFAGAYKLSKQIMLMLVNPFWDALYPNLTYSIDSNISFIRQKKIVLIVLFNALFGIVYGTILYLYADQFVGLVLGKDFIESVSVLKILIFACPIVITNVSVLNILISQKYERIVNISTLLNIVIILGLLSYLMEQYGNTGAAWAIVASEIILLSELVFFYILGRRK